MPARIDFKSDSPVELKLESHSNRDHRVTFDDWPDWSKTPDDLEANGTGATDEILDADSTPGTQQGNPWTRATLQDKAPLETTWKDSELQVISLPSQPLKYSGRDDDGDWGDSIVMFYIPEAGEPEPEHKSTE